MIQRHRICVSCKHAARLSACVVVVFDATEHLHPRCCGYACRPLSPGGRAQLEICLGVAAEAVGILGKTCASMTQICSSLPSCASDSYVYRCGRLA